MDIKEISSAKALSEAFKKEEAKEHLNRKNEIEISKKGNQYAAQANKIAMDSNQIAQESNQIARRSNKLAWLAIAISIVGSVQ